MKKMPSMIVSLLCALALLFSVEIGQAQTYYTNGSFDLAGATCRFATGVDAEQTFPYWQARVDNDGKVYKLTVANNAIDELYVDGEKIPVSQIPDFQSFIAPFIQSIIQKVDIDRRQAELEGQLARLDQYQRTVVTKRLAEIDGLMKNLDQEASTSDRQISVDANGQTDGARKRCKLKHEKDMLSDENEELNEKREILLRYRNELSRKENGISEDDLAQRGKVMQAILLDLKKENLVLNTRGLSFKLSNVELVVNGKKADAAIHQRLCAKYIPSVRGETGFMYHWKIRQAK